MSQLFKVASDREWASLPRARYNLQFVRTDLHGDIYQALEYLKANPNRIVKIKLAEGIKYESKRSVAHEYASRQKLPRLSTLWDPSRRWLLFTARAKRDLPLPLPPGIPAKRLFMSTTAAEWRDVRTTFDRRHTSARRSA
ncbi:MAG: hypothetical protein LAO20_16675 [Acidobacteriia bacterium]|nr:hypothetical protein [Terriglobia bacterium]